MRAAVMHEPHKPLVIEELDVESPHPGEVVVRLSASGVCRSDLHALEGESPVSNPPLVLGHEGAGIVEEVGEAVTGLARGDAVVIALYGPCGTCNDCRAGDITNCWSGCGFSEVRNKIIEVVVLSGELVEAAGIEPAFHVT